jgi:hypothetical protein
MEMMKVTKNDIITATPEWLNERAANVLWENFQPTNNEEESNIAIHKKYWYRATNGMFEGKIVFVEDGIFKVWNPAEDIRDAWTLVDSMHKDGDYLSLEYQAGVFPKTPRKLGWIAKFRRSEMYAFGNTAPEAICKVFLLATEPGN